MAERKVLDRCLFVVEDTELADVFALLRCVKDANEAGARTDSPLVVSQGCNAENVCALW